LVIGYWLLVIGYWLLVIGYWLLVIGYWLLGHWALLEVHQTVGKAYFESGFLNNKLNSKNG
jgi:hypothetical protein